MQLLGMSGFAKVLLLVTWFIITVQQNKTPNRCDEKSAVTYHTPCTSCAASKAGLCPRGFRRTSSGIGNGGCSYTVKLGGEVLTLSGCSHTCVKTITERKCCKGFWGTTCLACPGGSENPCSGHGTCMDGITGTGTCICKENFGGFACQECANENAYGPTCSSVCSCGRGICSTGISGVGSCICPAGYTGPECKEASPVCKALNCPANSRCIDWGNGTTLCECMPGFQRAGKTCKELNPCDGNVCNIKAACQSLGRGRYRCTCQSGYQGDGKVCIPINSCMNNNGGCPENSTDCVVSGLGKNYCACKPEFQKAKSSNACVLKNSCDPNNGTCLQGSTRVCQEGEIGNGYQCFGNLMEQMRKLNEKGRTRGQLTAILNIFEKACSLTLRKFGPFTLLIPVTRNFKINETLKAQMCQLCIIPGHHLMDDLFKLKRVWTLAGVPVEFSGTGYKYKGQGMSGYNYTLSQRDIPAANGIIHISSGPRLIVVSDGLGNPKETAGRIISKNSKFARFQTLIENSNMPDILDRQGHFTVFAPSTEAIESLRDGRLIHLLVKARDKLTELVKHHVYSTATVTIDKLITLPRMLTMANQIITINITTDGKILIGDTGVPIINRDIIASNGIIHTIDGILIPPSILPILPHICNDIQYKTIMGVCVPCGSLNTSTCPEGSTTQETPPQQCIYHEGRLVRKGCAKTCNLTSTVPGCCKGFFGLSCKQCPGGYANPCYNHGNCSDGIHGTGLCHCFSGFKGIGCHVCTDPNKHGYNCNEDCLCVHGICDNRPGSKGVCQPKSCKAGFYGEFCDRTSVPCGPSGLSTYCHMNAICEIINSTTRCVCEDGYEGDGLSCNPVDLCKQPNRGGCSENAECTSTGPGNATCQCNIGWTGDGQECVVIDRCSEEDRGGCHTNAQCRFVGPGQNECECLKGYTGDGYECSAVDPCLENNGNCDSLAECVPTGAGERKCLCPDGYSGDGMTCYGDILIEMSTNPDLGEFHEWIKRSSFSIPDGVNVTALVPTNGAIEQLRKNETDLWLKTYMLPFLIRAHFLQNAFTLEQLKQYGGQELPTLNPSTKWQINNSNGAVTIQNANVLISDVPAVNGIILIINKVLLPFVGDIPPPPLSLNQQLDQVPSFSMFKKLLVEYQLVDELQSQMEGYTVLVPDNSAIEYYCNISNIQQLDNETVKYHIIPKVKLETKDLKDGLVKDTMLGKGYQVVFYQSDNMIYANDAELSGMFYKTRYGMLLGIKKVLKAQKKRCDVTKIQLIKGPCLHCSLTPSCPPGTVPAKTVTEVTSSECVYTKFRNGKMVHLLGCLSTCANVTTILGCCKGYFGQQCEACPGEPGNWCSGSGECQDGIDGTGECKCEEGFQGVACEMCEAERYGEKCKSACSCLHGKCNDGLSGDGTCRCYTGWQGERCDTVSVMDPCNGTCHASANCISGNPLSPSYCVCSADFTGNGTYCSEINLCSVNNGGCSRYANCTKLSAAKRQCTCKEGYSGNGIRCKEINPCYINNGGCNKYATCYSTFFKKVTCSCKPGYSGDGKNTCVLIDPCMEKNGGCHMYARCTKTGISTRNCTCWSNYVGDGVECRGKISRELSHEEAAAGFNRYILMSDVTDLSGKGPFTVFVPVQNVTQRNSTTEEWMRRFNGGDLVRYHIVDCQQLLLSELKSQKFLTTLQGNKIEITEKKGVIYLNKDTEIIKSDIIARDGIFHYINKVLLPYDINSKNASLKAKKKNVTEAAIIYGYTIFSKLLKDADLLPMVNDTTNQPFTMLWPTDDAFKALPKERQEWLYDTSNSGKLAAYLKVHMIRDQKIIASNLRHSDNLRTMHGSTISFSCNSSTVGEITVDNGNARIIERHLIFSEGIAYGIDQLLEPPDMGARCDEFEKEEVLGRCGACVYTPPCPSGTKHIGISLQSCDRMSSRFRHRTGFLLRNPYRHLGYTNPFFLDSDIKDGCQKRCVRITWVKRCCKNHHGRDCQVCPGGLEAPCGNHGICNDGVNGTGICNCTKGFYGTACELCEQGRYGPDCKECNCTGNGLCEDGITGSGLCFCKEGWTGQQCETKLDVKPVCSPECDSNAVCRANNTCECNPFYEGDGRSCTVVNLCHDGNNPCHQFGVCSQLGINVTCTCKPDYEGDGYYCSAIDMCANGNNGNCSEHANCINTGPNQRRCECKDGYIGNGVQCLEKAIPPIDRCLEMNGNCHPEATCTDLHYEDETVGVFHQQSSKGRYLYTYDDANKACESEGALLATFDQLSAAQQKGFHLCVAGWLVGGKVGYPTTYPSNNCGSGHVGIMDYGVRPNMSEKWDAYCYRFQDVQCDCRYGYVGDGFYCNGNFLEVLSLNTNFTAFYSMLLDYANTTEGMEFLDFLSNETTFETLFVPVDSGFVENETLTGRDIEHHVTTNNSFLAYLNLTAGTVLPSKLGYSLSIGDSASSNRTLPSDSRLVNDKLIVSWNIPTFNGIIHVIEAPLKAPPPPPVVIAKVDSPHQGAVATTLSAVMVITVIAVFAGGVFYYFRRRNEGFLFHYFKNDENDLMPSKNEHNSALASVHNPMYDAHSHFCDPFNDPMDIDFSDTQKILEN